jgi:hypothetical protein
VNCRVTPSLQNEKCCYTRLRPYCLRNKQREEAMKQNVGDLDRGIRYAAGGAALGLGLFGRMPFFKRLLMIAFAGTSLATASTRYCPMNEKLGINTMEDEEASTGSLPGYIPAGSEQAPSVPAVNT